MRELQAETVFQPADLTPSLIVTTWLENGADGGAAFDLDHNSTALIVERLRPDATPERKALSSELPAPAWSFA
jgi:hypothetical protein